MNEVCMLMPSSTPNQIRSMPSLAGTRASRGTTRNEDERKLEEVKKERQKKDHRVDRDQKAQLAARQAGQQMFDPHRAVHALEGQAKDRRAQQDEHHEARQLGGR